MHRIKRLLARKVERSDLTSELKDKLLETVSTAADKTDALLQEK